MRVGVIGTGYVGLVTGACLAESGNHVVCADHDAGKVAELHAGRCPLFEPGLEEVLRENLAAARLTFTTDTAQAVAGMNVVFIAVGTPPLADGSADLSGIEAVAAAIGAAMTGKLVVVVKSTVPPGTGARVEQIIGRAAQHAFQVVSNPEFLKEGAAVEDFLRPDRVVIGAEDAAAAELVAELYKPFVRNNKPILIMSRMASELTKYAANAYLATRISFINEIAALCAALGVDVDQVRRGIGADARIGQHFMYPGIGYGGSCFPKDVQALAHQARQVGVAGDLLEAVHRRNQQQAHGLADKVIERLGPDLRTRRLAVWGLAFKPKTDDVREAPALAIIRRLLDAGAAVRAHDPKALDGARRELGDRIGYVRDAYAALPGADALLILTEWMEYRTPDFERIAAALRQKLIFDGRNIFALATMRQHGFEYHSIGRPVVMPPRDRA